VENSKRPSIILTLLMQWFLMGLGYLNLGLPKRALFSFLAFCVVYTLNKTLLGGYFVGLVIGDVTLIGIMLFIFIDTVRCIRQGLCRSENKFRQKKYLVPCAAGAIIIYIGLSSIDRFTAYVIPSGSMCPSLYDGDHFIAQKNVLPTRGEITLYRNPKDLRTIFAKRVVGIPGDKIRIENGHLFVNGNDIFQGEVQATDLSAGCRHEYEPKNAHMLQAQLDGKSFLVNIDGHSKSADLAEITVGEKNYFVIGDNWNNSYDSRFAGQIPAEVIFGKPLYIYYSSDDQGIHWERMGLTPN
jgi:signal peptidase I